MDGFALNSVDSLVGRVTTALADEAQLLSGVRGDVSFIRDEIDCMNGLLLHLAAAGLADAGDHQHVQAWMRQVADLAADSHDCVSRYIRQLSVGGRGRGGPLGCVRRAQRRLWTIGARHRIAEELRQLKVRAREVGERRERYGITVPLAAGDQERAGAGTGSHRRPAPPPRATAGLDDETRRLALELEDHRAPHVCGDDTSKVIRWLTEDADDNAARLRVILVAGPSGAGKSALAWWAYRHPAAAATFDCRSWCNVGSQDLNLSSLEDVAEHLLSNVEMPHGRGVRWREDETSVRVLKDHLRGRRFLLVLDGVSALAQPVLTAMKGTLRWCPYIDGSAVLMTTQDVSLVPAWDGHSIRRLIIQPSMVDTFTHRALSLVPDMAFGERVVLREMVRRLSTGHHFYMKMLLHLLYANPSRTMQELRDLCSRLAGDEEPLKIAKQVFMFNYDDLTFHYRACLLYLAIFPHGDTLRRTSLTRRWAVEGLVGKTDDLTALQVADRCFDALLDRGFVVPVDIGALGKVKSCRLEASVHGFVTWIARHSNFANLNQPSSLASRLSIRNGVDWHQISKDRYTTFNSNPLQKIICCYSGNEVVSDCCDYVVTFLESLPSSPRLELLKVLDLEGCQGLKGRHLETICDQMYQLQYLCLRRTNLTRLPKGITKLRYLETLDIRETKVRDFGTKPVRLPMLKHLLAGGTDATPTQETVNSSGSFSTVYIPHGIGSMGNLQILCHVEVSHYSELEEISQLLQLRKLGVVLRDEDELKHLFRAINKLNGCLLSLSIRIKEPTNDASEDPLLKTPPKSLESLSICGLKNKLPYWVDDLHKLAKITLTETFLKENSIRTLGQLRGLRCLRLHRNSFVENMLAFGETEFRNLKFLVIRGAHITDISFCQKAAPKLENVVWSFNRVQSISGIGYLERLNQFELNGTSITDTVREAIAAYPNHHVFKYNLQSQVKAE